MRCAQLKGSGARSNGSGEVSAELSRPLRPSKNKRCPPAGRRAEPYFFLPISPSHGLRPWDYFYSFCQRSCVLPMLSLFHIGGPCGEQESFQTRCPGYGITGKLWGLRPQTPVKIKKTKTQTLPVIRVPRTTGKEEKRKLWGLRLQTPVKIKKQRFKPSLLSAFREQQEGKKKRKLWGLRPQTPMKIKNKGFKPSLLPAFREQQGGKKKGEEWGLFAPNPPTRNNVPGPDQFGTSHVRHDGAWAAT